KTCPFSFLRVVLDQYYMTEAGVGQKGNTVALLPHFLFSQPVPSPIPWDRDHFVSTLASSTERKLPSISNAYKLALAGVAGIPQAQAAADYLIHPAVGSSP